MGYELLVAFAGVKHGFPQGPVRAGRVLTAQVQDAGVVDATFSDWLALWWCWCLVPELGAGAGAVAGVAGAGAHAHAVATVDATANSPPYPGCVILLHGLQLHHHGLLGAEVRARQHLAAGRAG